MLDELQGSETVGDIAFRRIRSDIISGTLAPNTKLKLEQARTRYAVSVSTLREIMSRLTAENLVVAEGQRGFVVSPVSVSELRELAELRILLEGHAVTVAFAEGDLDWEANIAAAHHRLSSIERSLLQGDTARTLEWVRYDWEFHLALVSACKSKTLMETLSSVFDRFLRYHLVAENFRGQPVADDHRTLFDLALRRDAAAARDILADHVRKGAEHVEKSGRIQ